MEIIRITPQGYCDGVINAIAKIKDLVNNNPTTPIYIWGHLVHNELVSKALKKMHVQTLDSSKDLKKTLEELNKGIVVTSAHGISNKEIEIIKSLGFSHFDATCNVIKHIQELIKNDVKNHDVIYIGNKNHPEVKAILAISNKLHSISNVNDIKNLELVDTTPVVYCQTTLSHHDVANLYSELEKVYPKAIFNKEICNAVSLRQHALIHALDEANLVIVVGSKLSSNTSSLVKIAKEANKETMFINNPKELDLNKISNQDKIIIVSGTSTPNYLVTMVEEYIKTKQLIPLGYEFIL